MVLTRTRPADAVAGQWTYYPLSAVHLPAHVSDQVGALYGSPDALYLAGHSNMSITKGYIDPQEHNTRAAIERAQSAQGGHSSGHNAGARSIASMVNLPVNA